MTQLFIIGNGFDINLGMKTGYQDFYDYYKDIKNDDPDIIAMKQNIEAGRYTTWSDLEAGLGEYTEQFDKPEVFIKCIEDIKSVLAQFLSMQYENRAFQSDFNKILDDFRNPDRYLDQQIMNNYYRYLRDNIPNTSKDESAIVTFNYTSTLEGLTTINSIRQFPILHIHGYINDSIVLGVNDVEQIANLSFRSNRNIKEEFIKPDFNTACLNDRNGTFEAMISKADVIILFGLSLGETDRKWWRLIGEKMTNNKRDVALLYFPYDNKKDTISHPNYKLRWTESYQKQLLSVFGLSDDQVQVFLKRTFIGINKDIFKLPQKPSIKEKASSSETR